MLLQLSVDLFFKRYIFNRKYISRYIVRVSNCLAQDQDRRSVGSDLGRNCLQTKKGNSLHAKMHKGESKQTTHIAII